MAKIYASKTPEVSERELRNGQRSRELAPQGMVLLENNGALPLTGKPGKIALYGNGARRTISSRDWKTPASAFLQKTGSTATVKASMRLKRLILRKSGRLSARRGSERLRTCLRTRLSLPPSFLWRNRIYFRMKRKRPSL